MRFYHKNNSNLHRKASSKLVLIFRNQMGFQIVPWWLISSLRWVLRWQQAITASNNSKLLAASSYSNIDNQMLESLIMIHYVDDFFNVKNSSPTCQRCYHYIFKPSPTSVIIFVVAQLKTSEFIFWRSSIYLYTGYDLNFFNVSYVTYFSCIFCVGVRSDYSFKF